MFGSNLRIGPGCKRLRPRYGPAARLEAGEAAGHPEGPPLGESHSARNTEPSRVDCRSALHPMIAESLAKEIAGLCRLTRADLIERWIELHGSSPTKTLTKDLLVRGIAYAMQERRHGGLTRVEKKALAALARGNANPTPAHLKPGTRFYRTWRGITHEVLVLEDG